MYSDCDHLNQTCTNTLGSYLCEDLDECSEGHHECDVQKSNCSNTVGTYTCDCFSGYSQSKGNDNSCYDINECNEIAYNCSENALCKNLGKSHS